MKPERNCRYPQIPGRKPGATWNPENRAKAYAEPGRRLPGRPKGYRVSEETKAKIRAYLYSVAPAPEQRLNAGSRKAAVKRKTQEALEAYETLVDRE